MAKEVSVHEEVERYGNQLGLQNVGVEEGQIVEIE